MEIYFILLVAVLYFVFAIYRLPLAVKLLPLFFPLYLVKVNFCGIPCNLMELFIMVSAFAFVINWLRDLLKPTSWISSLFLNIKDTFFHKEGFIIRNKYLFGGVVFFIIAALLSLIVTQKELFFIDGTLFSGQRVALGIFKGWILCPILYLLLVLSVVKTKEGFLDLLNAYSVSAFILALWGIYQAVTHQYVTPDGRASGPFESANYLSLYIAPVLVYMVVRLKELIFPLSANKSKIGSKLKFFKESISANSTLTSLFLVGSLIVFLALIATKSYSALIAFFVAILFYFVLEYRGFLLKKKDFKMPWKSILGVSAFVFSVLFIVFIIDPSKWMEMLQFTQRNSSSVRVEVYTIAWDLIVNNWLFGIGMGQFPLFYQVESVSILGHVPYEWNMLHPHNLYLALWLNMGILGLISFVYIIGICFHYGLMHIKEFAFEKVSSFSKMKVIALSMLVVIFVHGFFDTPFFKNDLSLIFWTIVAVICAMNSEKQKD